MAKTKQEKQRDHATRIARSCLRLAISNLEVGSVEEARDFASQATDWLARIARDGGWAARGLEEPAVTGLEKCAEMFEDTKPAGGKS